LKIKIGEDGSEIIFGLNGFYLAGFAPHDASSNSFFEILKGGLIGVDGANFLFSSAMICPPSCWAIRIAKRIVIQKKKVYFDFQKFRKYF